MKASGPVQFAPGSSARVWLIHLTSGPVLAVSQHSLLCVLELAQMLKSVRQYVGRTQGQSSGWITELENINVCPKYLPE